MATSNIQKLDKWHKTRTGYLAFGLAELLMAYGFASWAIDTGSLWQYAIAIVLLFGGFSNLFRIFRPVKNERK